MIAALFSCAGTGKGVGATPLDTAIADYAKAVKLNPNNAAAYANRGLAYQKKGDTGRANADFDRARSEP